MKEIDKRYLDLLFEEAKALDPVGDKRSRVMAALVFKKTLIILGNNAEKTDPIQRRLSRRDDKAFIHAEISAIKRAVNHFRGNGNRLAGATLYVMRAKKEKGNGSKPSSHWCWGNSKPCPICSQEIKKYGIKRIVYSLDENHVCGESSYHDL